MDKHSTDADLNLDESDSVEDGTNFEGGGEGKWDDWPCFPWRRTMLRQRPG